ncbi:MAG: GIY-YIG nuclease family protein [Atopobiaceae bacterium]|nr:GIY-YIG nuclease family protein [Atopobiaceae bacterium]
MCAQAKTINMLLYSGGLQGVISVEDSGWNAGELYSAPRESMRELIETGACDRYGVYLLLSRDRVYVGQSSDLARRLAQHMAGKDWWTNAVVLTTKDDSLGHTDIDWLESELIEKARFVGRLDCDNVQRGNPTKVDRFREVALSQYLDEALFLMEFIGIPVFASKPSPRDRARALAETARVDVTDVRNRLAFGKRAKGLAVEYLGEHGIEVTGSCNYAVLAESGLEFFVNPAISRLSSDWSIVLNDTSRRMLLALMVPANTLRLAEDGGGGLMRRADKPQYIDLHIDPVNLRDRRSRIDFSMYVMGRVAY